MVVHATAVMLKFKKVVVINCDVSDGVAGGDVDSVW